MKDSQLGPMARVAEALQKSVDTGFGLSRWSFFFCHFPLSSVSMEAIQSFIPYSGKNLRKKILRFR